MPKLLIFRNVIVIILLLINYNGYSQINHLEENSLLFKLEGDEICTSWSDDGSNILFSIENNNRTSLGIYNFNLDTVFIVSDSIINYQNPVWHPNGKQIIFDSNHSGYDFIYIMNIDGSAVKPLFKRKIACKEAAFSSSSRQVYFTGFDALGNNWETYSYDFVYDNLNQITKSKFGIFDPAVTIDGKHLVCTRTDPFSAKVYLEKMNWYGENNNELKDIEGYDVVWDRGGLKFYFIRSIDENVNDIYSIWKDGTHLERITHLGFELSSPVISPEGDKMLVSIKDESGFDIHLINLD